MAQIIPVAPFDYIVFGGTGDLALRKLLPALYQRDRDGQIPDGARIIGVSRSKLSNEEYAQKAGEWAKKLIPAAEFDAKTWARFAERLSYVGLDVTSSEGWEELAAVVEGSTRIRVFYLATAPDLFGPICRSLEKAGLVSEDSRVVLEKPIGKDLASAKRINQEVGAVFNETQVYRIDHYLGKETVQNLLALRFANSLFEPLWNSSWIDHVQITVAETVGVEGRAGYYDTSGALRDMVQNHLLQLLCLVAMEPPVHFDKDAVRDEKLKVLRALKPMEPEAVLSQTVRGQYKGGAANGAAVPGYIEELGRDSLTESFVAMKLEVENWRWAGVPFYLRTGKRMHQKTSEIVIQFRPVPHSIFPKDSGMVEANRLVVRLQPNEGIRMHLMIKDPGPGGLRLRPAPLDLTFAEAFKVRSPDAYERLLLDVVRGNATLFMRRDEVEAAWTWVEPILEAWQRRSEHPKPYTAGTWGPAASIALIERDGRTWHEEVD
ncbi:glucose-6-phosphate dehydrogenase [Lacibacterium aquatile]|uniref:Glucose-6-phosphate 1-dehydrogenase n=1 Tax=Lacibacterium aquatile TaxID=1168082 RepID=A0ABW5DVE9_9PROT